MKYPKFIKPGDTIGFVAPSFGVTTEPYKTRFEHALRRIQKRGYKVKIAPSVYKNDGIGISTNPKDAAQDLMDIYLDPEVDAVISVGGGELMSETTSYIDFEKLKNAEPKWYLGYSDNTNMIYPNATLNGVAGLYGPCATEFGKPWERTQYYCFDIMEGKNFKVNGFSKFESPEYETDNPVEKYNLTERKIITSYMPCNGKLKKVKKSEEINLSGRLIGGCLDVVDNLSSTRFDGIHGFNEEYKEDGIIWMLEACDYNTMTIRRSLWHLKESGMFKYVKGFVFGRPLYAYNENLMGVDRFNAVTDILEDFNVPVIIDADFGHISPVVPLVLGGYANINIKGNTFSITYEMK